VAIILERTMKTTVLILSVAFLAAACSSEPTKEPPKPVVSEARQKVAPVPPAPQPENKPTTKAVEKPSIAVHPLDDSKGALSKRSVYYAYDGWKIEDQYKALLQAHARYLTERRGAKVRVEGNCDERGSREYNLALGQRRADSVKSALEVLGVQGGQIETVSWGKEKPKATGHDEAAWAENRRSDIVYERRQ
jgi:peptidoglycan-associated lipoprotein